MAKSGHSALSGIWPITTTRPTSRRICCALSWTPCRSWCTCWPSTWRCQRQNIFKFLLIDKTFFNPKRFSIGDPDPPLAVGEGHARPAQELGSKAAKSRHPPGERMRRECQGSAQVSGRRTSGKITEGPFESTEGSSKSTECPLISTEYPFKSTGGYFKSTECPFKSTEARFFKINDGFNFSSLANFPAIPWRVPDPRRSSNSPPTAS